MNVVIEDNSKKEKKLRIFYITLLAICIVAIILALVIQKINEDDHNYIGNNVKLPEVSEEKARKEALKAEIKAKKEELKRLKEESKKQKKQEKLLKGAFSPSAVDIPTTVVKNEVE